MAEFKSLEEIADEYEENIKQMKRAQEDLRVRLKHETNLMRALRLRRAVKAIDSAIGDSHYAIAQMRNRHG